MLCASVYLFSSHANTQRPKNPIGKIFTETRREKTLVFCCSIVLDVTFRRIFCIYYLHLAFGCCNHILIYFIQNEHRCVYTTKCYYAKCLFWNLCIQIWLKPVAYTAYTYRIPTTQSLTVGRTTKKNSAERFVLSQTPCLSQCSLYPQYFIHNMFTHCFVSMKQLYRCCWNVCARFMHTNPSLFVWCYTKRGNTQMWVKVCTITFICFGIRSLET